jgi:hypothetical protein
MIRFCIIFLTILGFSVGIKLQLTEYRNLTATSLTSNITLISKSSCIPFGGCGEYVKVAKSRGKSDCCAAWKLLDCAEKKAKDCSNKDELLSFLKSSQSGLESTLCKDYKRDETFCGLPWWAILLIVIGCIAVVGGVGFFVYKKFKNKHL